MPDNGKPPKVTPQPTGEGIAGDVVRPPWWDDPQEAARESVRLLGAISGTLASMDARLAKLENLVPQGMRSANPLSALFPRRGST